MSKVAEWTFDADGNGAWVDLEHIAPFNIVGYGSTWGSGSVTFQCSPNGGTDVIPVTDTNLPLTANGIVGVVRLPDGFSVRPVMAGSTSPDVTIELYETVVV